MNVGKLREILRNLDALPDETEIVVGGPDHSYRRARVEVVTAESDGKRGGYIGEYHEGNTGTGCQKVRVLLIGE